MSRCNLIEHEGEKVDEIIGHVSKIIQVGGVMWKKSQKLTAKLTTLTRMVVYVVNNIISVYFNVNLAQLSVTV